MEYSNLFVCLMGMGTVFVGLICIVFLVMAMSAICRGTEGKHADVPAMPAAVVPAAVSAGDKMALMAAIAAAIADDMGTDAANIRIHSIKRV